MLPSEKIIELDEIKEDEIIELLPDSNIVLPNLNLPSQTEKISLVQQPISGSYLSIFNQQELAEIAQKYQRTTDELEKTIRDYRMSYWYYRLKNVLAMSLNVFYLAFQINTGTEGLQNSINIIAPNISLPNAVAMDISISFALLDFLFYLLTFSPALQATKSTLQYAFEDPLFIRLKKLLPTFRHQPFRASINLAKFSFHQSVLFTTNLTGAMTEIIDNYYYLDQTPSPVKWGIISFLLYFGNYYFKKFMNGDYYRGLDFWFNNPHDPWLIGEIWRGNISIPLQIFLQGTISTVLLRSYPYYYYLADATKEILGFWLPPLLTALLVLCHSFCVLYPATFYHYLENKKQIKFILKEKVDSELMMKMIEQQMNQLKLHHSHLNQPFDWQEMILQEYIQLQKKIVTNKIIQEIGPFYLLKKEPHNLIPLIYRGLIGGYLGYHYLSPLLLQLINEPIIMSIISSFLSAMCFSGVLYYAEKERLMDKLIIEYFGKNNIHTTEYSQAETKTSLPANVIAYLLSSGNGISSMMTTIATGVRTFGVNSPIVLGSVAVIAGENMLNGIYYSTKKISSVVEHLLPSRQSFLSKIPGTFFYRNPSHEIESKQSLSIALQKMS